MKSVGNIMILVGLAVILISPASAQQLDKYGSVDTIYAEVARLDDFNWSVTISCFNDENIVGIAVPLKLSAGLNQIVADSAIYTGGRVAHWTYPGFRPDTAIQCVTLGMIANIGPTNHTLPAGTGRLVTIFVSSLEEKKIEQLRVDTTTTHPNNALMMIVDLNQKELGDSIKIDAFDRELIPAWVVRETESVPAEK